MGYIKKARPAVRRYPWAVWFARPEFTITQGKDFDAQMHGMVAMIRNQASRRKKYINAQVPKDRPTTIVVKVLGDY